MRSFQDFSVAARQQGLAEAEPTSLGPGGHQPLDEGAEVLVMLVEGEAWLVRDGDSRTPLAAGDEFRLTAAAGDSLRAGGSGALCWVARRKRQEAQRSVVAAPVKPRVGESSEGLKRRSDAFAARHRRSG